MDNSRASNESKLSNEKACEPATGKKPYKAPTFRVQHVFGASGLICSARSTTETEAVKAVGAGSSEN